MWQFAEHYWNKPQSISTISLPREVMETLETTKVRIFSGMKTYVYIGQVRVHFTVINKDELLH